MKTTLIFLVGLLLILQAAGCGGNSSKQQNTGDSKQKAQGQNQEQSKPIDSALKEQMNMYKNIKQYEYEEAEKLRKADKEQLKKMQKERQSSIKEKSGTKSNDGSNKQ